MNLEEKILELLQKQNPICFEDFCDLGESKKVFKAIQSLEKKEKVVITNGGIVYIELKK